jgi:hypothetical protein
MPPAARLFAPDRAEIVDLASWLLHAPPERGAAQWKDGFSAKEQAKAWVRTGQPMVPEELWSAIADRVGEVDDVYGRPEHRTRLDNYSRARRHDLFACARRGRETVLVVGIEAKACERFDGIVADRATAAPPSKKRARCNLLSRALFGRDVFDEDSGEILDPALSMHGYQLWTAAVGTIIEAQQRGVPDALLIVHQFVPRDADAAKKGGDTRAWKAALTANTAAFETFAADLAAGGSTSHGTDFVKPGTSLRVAKVQSVIDV